MIESACPFPQQETPSPIVSQLIQNLWLWLQTFSPTDQILLNMAAALWMGLWRRKTKTRGLPNSIESLGSYVCNTSYPIGQTNMTTITGQQDPSKYYYLWLVNEGRFLVLCPALLVQKIVQCEIWHWKLKLWNRPENIRELHGYRELGLLW